MTNRISQNVTYARARYIQMSPSKVQRVLDQIRGKSYKDTLILLEFMPYRSCKVIWSVVRSACANAENNAGLSKANLFINEAYVGKGPINKRFRIRAQGRLTRIQKRTCHITIGVSELNE